MEWKIKKIGKNLLELEERRSKHAKNYDHDDVKYKGVREVGNSFNQSTDEDYYKPIKAISVFDNENNYIEYESKGNKDKILSVKEYLDMVRSFLSDLIDDHKTHKKLKVNTGNKVIYYKTQQGE